MTEGGETASEAKPQLVMEEFSMEVIFYVFRSMRQDEDGSPEIAAGARGLGVRPGVGYGTDIPVDPEGYVYPQTGGLSVAPGDPMYLPDVRRSRELGGRGKDPVWRLDVENLPTGLIYRADPKNRERHGFIEPVQVMLFEEFQALVAATRPHWTRVV